MQIYPLKNLGTVRMGRMGRIAREFYLDLPGTVTCEKESSRPW